MKKKRESSRLRLALASYDASELRVHEKYLLKFGNFEVCQGYQYGEPLLRELRSGGDYDVVLLDDELRDMDALQFMAAFYSIDKSRRPMLVLLSNGGRQENSDAVLHPRKNYCIIKPYDLRTLNTELQILCSLQSGNLQVLVQHLYQEWGVKKATAGWEYLTEAVECTLASDRKLLLTKEILLPVAEKAGVDAKAVESGIRRVLEDLNRRMVPAWRSFKEQYSDENGKLTPHDFIYAIRAEVLQSEQEGGACFHDQTNECPPDGR